MWAFKKSFIIVFLSLVVFMGMLCFSINDTKAISTRAVEGYSDFYKNFTVTADGYSSDYVHFDCHVRVRYFTAGVGTTTSTVYSYGIGPNYKFFDVKSVTSSPAKGGVIKNNYVTLTIVYTFAASGSPTRKYIAKIPVDV